MLCTGGAFQQVFAHKARKPLHGRVGCQFLHGKRADWPLSCSDQEIGRKNPVSTTGVNHVVGATAMAIISIANSNRALFLLLNILATQSCLGYADPYLNLLYGKYKGSQ